MGNRMIMDSERLLLVAFLMVVVPAGRAWAAPPSTDQVAAAAGRADLRVVNRVRLWLPETGREAYAVKTMTPDGHAAKEWSASLGLAAGCG